MSMMEQDITRKERLEESITCLEFKADNSGKYKVKGICDITVYVRESKGHHPPGFYYLLSWSSYPKGENSWKPALAV